MKKPNKKIKMIGKHDFGTWLKKGEIVEMSESWVLFACDKKHAKLLKGEARKIRGFGLLKKYGLDPFKISYGRNQIIEMLVKLDDTQIHSNKNNGGKSNG